LVKQVLKLWAKTSFNPSAKEKEKIKCKLENFQKYLENKEITLQLQKREIKLQTQYQRALRNEEETWQLKSQSLWLKVSDKNTKFFHNQAKARQSRNNVASITLEDGTK
jgi:uncharacterized protein YecT (DUF1311 family)